MRRRRSRFRGNALVELAILSSILFPILTGVTQFGYSMYAYNTLQGAVHAGVRLASVLAYTSTTSTPAADYSTAVKNTVVYGKPDPQVNGQGAITDTVVIPGLTTANVELVITMNGSEPSTVTVRIINFTVDGIFAQYTFNQKPSAMFTFNG